MLGLQSRTLKKLLEDWTDTDVAMYFVAVSLGVAPEFEEWDFWGGKKWLFWSNNPICNTFYELLEVLTKEKILEKNEEMDQYRWNKDFNWKDY